MKNTFLKSAILLLTGGVAGQCFALGRNVLIARGLGPEVYGVGAALLVGVAMVELVADLSIDKVLVQAKEGAQSSFLAAAHLFALFRAVVVAAILLLAAPAIAWLLDVQEYVAMFRWLAILPLISGWRNLELSQRQREGDFRPLVITGLVAQIIATAAAIPLVIYLKSPIAVVMCSGIAAVATVVGSNILARERFRIAWNRKHVGTILRFGLPLVLNGSILFLSLQGDRIVVLRGFGPTGFALLSVALTLVSVPVNLTAKILGDLLFPRFSGISSDGGEFLSAAKSALGVYSLIGGFAVMSFVFLGPLVVPVYGPKYLAALDFFPLLGVAGAIRLLRAGQAMLAFSVGGTGIAPVAGVARMAGLLAAIAVVQSGGSIADVAIAMIGGEICSLVVGAFYLRKKAPVNPLMGIVGALWILACFGAAMACRSWGLAAQASLLGCFGILALGCSVVVYKHFQRRLAGHLVRSRAQVEANASP